MTRLSTAIQKQRRARGGERIKHLNILVFPAGTEIAFEINFALRNNKAVELYGATSVPCHASFVYKNCVDGLPNADDEGLIDALNKVIDEFGIDYVYPAHDTALLTLTRERKRVHAAVVTSPLETVEICRSKNKTYKYFRSAWYCPKIYLSADEVKQYPVFIKPSVGQGAVGAERVVSERKLREALSSGTEYAICEYLSGQEITVDCFTDRHGKLRYIGSRSRDRIRSGIAVRSRSLPLTEEVSSIAEDINSKLTFNGAWFVQLKQNENGEYKLMEIAPRIAGTMGLTRNIGVNMPLLTLYNMEGEDVYILSNGNDVLLDRAFVSRFEQGIEFDSVYVDYDDTLIVNGNVNPFLIAFLYQQKNNGKKLHLLSKHKGDVSWGLDWYNISRYLFDSIVNVRSGESKAKYIRGKAIFIDDSFAERKEVHKKCNIPVFDIDMVESLFDWRN